MEKSRQDRAMKRTSMVMNIQAWGLIFLLLWSSLFLLGVLFQLTGDVRIRELDFGRTLLISAPVAVVAETVIILAAIKSNPGREYIRLYKEFGSDSDELYEYALKIYERYRRSANKKAIAAEWALKLAAICLDRDRAGEALDHVRSADMTDYFKSPGFPGNMMYIITYFQLLMWIDIERGDTVLEEQHYAAGEEYFREIKKDSGFYPHITVTRCDHLIFRGETARAIELLRELEEYLEDSSNTDLLAGVYCRLGEAYLKQSDGARARENFDKSLSLCTAAEKSAMQRKIERLTGGDEHGVII